MTVKFKKDFANLTGFSPMRWQTRLFEEHFKSGSLPSAVDIPTGLGKTSVMAIWYLALKAGARLPRRLVYVVDRRAVVDQATTVADKIKERSGDDRLRVSTLRGQHVDQGEWLEDPTSPAINRCVQVIPEVKVMSVQEGPRGGLVGRVRLTFKHAIKGPIIIGRTCHFGGGLFSTKA